MKAGLYLDTGYRVDQYRQPWSDSDTFAVSVAASHSTRAIVLRGRKFIGVAFMSIISRTPRFFRILLLLTFVLAIAVIHIEGHAILKSSSPANGGFVTHPDMAVKLTFNVRVDAARSKLQVLMPDASTVELPIVKSPSPDMLISRLPGLKPGAYVIRWQVLAPDGHISRGEIPFTVRNP